VLNKLQSCSWISALGPEGHCTSRFKRARERCVFHIDRMWTSTRGLGGQAHVDTCGQREGGQKPDFFVDVINGW